MRNLITGIAGFVGSHLAEHLLHKGEDVSGFDLPTTSTEKINHILEKISLYRGDITSYSDIKNILVKSEPDRIYHLAAISHVKKSFESKSRTIEVNLFGALNFFEALLEFFALTISSWSFSEI